MTSQPLKSSKVFALFFLFSNLIIAQNNGSFWDKSTKEKGFAKQLSVSQSSNIQSNTYTLNTSALKKYLKSVPKTNTKTKEQKLLQFPNTDDTFESYSIVESSIMAPQLANKYPNIKTYQGQSVDNPANNIRFSITDQGLNTVSFKVGAGMQFISPVKVGSQEYIVSSITDASKLDEEWECGVIENDAKISKPSSHHKVANANDGLLREYDLALACTVEYARFHWLRAGLKESDSQSSKRAAVLAAMVVTVNRNNFVFMRDVSLKMNLVANNDQLIFIDSDNFTNANTIAMLNEAQAVIDGIIGALNYDIGHTLFTGSGGVAVTNTPCTNDKARGVSGSVFPVGSGFDLGLVAHEIGHQFGALHTFNGISSNCTGQQRTPSSAYEPGSGSTIMSYGGICAPLNVVETKDAYFHQKSIQLMSDNIKSGNGRFCFDATPTGNSAPTAEAGPSYVIPISTPYRLTGFSTDSDGTASHTYTWEQYDLGPAGLPKETNPMGPMVRSFEGTNNPTRYIPRLEDISANQSVSTTWEKLASVSRDHNFRLTVRDNATNGGQTAVDNMIVKTTSSAGPFIVTSQDTDQIVWRPGQTEAITWDVAGTTANGVNTAKVNILLSTDKGLTYNTVLASNVPNDGSHNIIVPNIEVPYARIMVEGSGNAFFNINDYFFAIGRYKYDVVDVCKNIDINTVTDIKETNNRYLGYNFTLDTSLIMTDLNITVNTTHPNSEDLLYGFRHPAYSGNSMIKLASGLCANTANTRFVFDDQGSPVNCATTANGDNILPEQSLSAVNGTDSQGIWTFFIFDRNIDGQKGTLDNITLNICQNTVAPVFDASLSNSEFDLENTVSVIPNPNNGQFSVNVKQASGHVNLQLFDIRGRSILSQSYTANGSFNKQINLGDVTSGMYLLKIKNGLKTITKKVVINHN